MAVLRAFRPLRYNPTAVGDLPAVVAPPYDVISAAQRAALHARSEYNVVRLILNAAADPYAAAAERLQAWRRDGVLVRDAHPSLGYHIEDFPLRDGSRRRREGILGIVRLEPFASGRIRPHERTFARAKEDRMRLLRACRANLSPIFSLFPNQMGLFDPLRQWAQTRRPDMALSDDAGVHHRLWLVTDPASIAATTARLADETLFIADGHHRYETAVSYAAEQRTSGNSDPEAPHNFVLMYLTSMSHPGLVILPTHRVLSAANGNTAAACMERLRPHFRLTAFTRMARAEFRHYLRKSAPPGSFGVVPAGSDHLYVATLTDAAALDTYAAEVAPVLRQVDVTVLDSVVLRGLLGIDCTAAAHDGRLIYTHDEDSALQAVEQGAAVAFLMNAPRIEDVQAVCLAGETMPQKSTYFYPKLLTGLVFHPLDEEPQPSARVAGVPDSASAAK